FDPVPARATCRARSAGLRFSFGRTREHFNHTRHSMADKVIDVLGATGQQGGGLVRSILGDSTGGVSVRAITRDPGKDSERKIASSDAAVVQADLDDAASHERAFAGAYGLYAVTNFWEHYFREPDTSAEREKAQAKNIAEAARRAGVQHVIWSTLEDTRPLMASDDTRM